MVGEDSFQWTMTPVEPGAFFRRDDGGASKSAKTALEDEPCASVAQRLGDLNPRPSAAFMHQIDEFKIPIPFESICIPKSNSTLG